MRLFIVTHKLCSKRKKSYQVDCVENLHLPLTSRTWIGKVVGVFFARRRISGGQSTQAPCVECHVSNDVQNLHVACTVNVNTLFQANGKPLDKKH